MINPTNTIKIHSSTKQLFYYNLTYFFHFKNQPKITQNLANFMNQITQLN
ncbi:hypothetical protein QE365_003021 [Acinetobacter baylyi]|nr:hypothetical protein [Acinetobacter baylyi]